MVRIKITEDHQMDGDGESLGQDSTGKNHTFWRHMGSMDVPMDLAIKLTKEDPARFEVVDSDKKIIEQFIDIVSMKTVTKKKKPKTSPVKVLEPKKENKVEVKPNPIQPPPAQPGTTQPIVNITLKELKGMDKDPLNDWAARRDYDVNPSKQTKAKMIQSLVKQIKARTGTQVV